MNKSFHEISSEINKENVENKSNNIIITKIDKIEPEIKLQENKSNYVDYKDEDSKSKISSKSINRDNKNHTSTKIKNHEINKETNQIVNNTDNEKEDDKENIEEQNKIIPDKKDNYSSQKLNQISQDKDINQNQSNMSQKQISNEEIRNKEGTLVAYETEESNHLNNLLKQNELTVMHSKKSSLSSKDIMIAKQELKSFLEKASKKIQFFKFTTIIKEVTISKKANKRLTLLLNIIKHNNRRIATHYKNYLLKFHSIASHLTKNLDQYLFNCFNHIVDSEWNDNKSAYISELKYVSKITSKYIRLNKVFSCISTKLKLKLMSRMKLKVKRIRAFQNIKKFILKKPATEQFLRYKKCFYKWKNYKLHVTQPKKSDYKLNKVGFREDNKSTTTKNIIKPSYKINTEDFEQMKRKLNSTNNFNQLLKKQQELETSILEEKVNNLPNMSTIQINRTSHRNDKFQEDLAMLLLNLKAEEKNKNTVNENMSISAYHKSEINNAHDLSNINKPLNSMNNSKYASKFSKINDVSYNNNILNDPFNPYSAYWEQKILQNRYGMKLVLDPRKSNRISALKLTKDNTKSKSLLKKSYLNNSIKKSNSKKANQFGSTIFNNLYNSNGFTSNNNNKVINLNVNVNLNFNNFPNKVNSSSLKENASKTASNFNGNAKNNQIILPRINNNK